MTVYVYEPGHGVIDKDSAARIRASRRGPAKPVEVRRGIRGRWIWDRARNELVPAHEYHRQYSGRSWQVMPDIEPYRAVYAGGEYVGSRSQHRAMLRAHGLTEVGNEKLSPPQPYEPKGVDTDIRRSLQEMGAV